MKPAALGNFILWLARPGGRRYGFPVLVDCAVPGRAVAQPMLRFLVLPQMMPPAANDP